MKKIMQRMRMFKCFSKAALCLMGAASFVACSSDDDVVEPTPETPVATAKYTMTLTASKGNTTRGLREGKDNDNWNIIETYWTAGETVDVVQNNTYLGTLTATPDPSDDTKATLSGTLEKAPNTDVYAPPLYFYLHGCDRSYTGQVGTLADIAANHDYDRYYLAMNCINVDEGNMTISSNYPVQFANSMQNIVKFFLYKADGTPIAAQSLTIHDGQDGLVQAWNNLTNTGTYGDVTINLSPATNEIYAALDFYRSPADLTLTAFDGTDIYTYTKTGVTAFNTAGKYFEIAVKMTKPALVDLSMVDCAGKARTDGMWTANCYMVHTAGYYKLPLVYGNAIKDGEDYTAAYNPGGTTSTNYCANFVNHAGDAINAPWITKSTDGTGVNKGMGITVASAELLWQDAQGLITKVGIDGDYLTLTVGKNAATQEGNALVAAKDADGTIVWSWHIWVTKQTFAAEVLTTITLRDYVYKVTPVNLGWVGEATSTTGYCTFYQWGRKDAFKGTGSCTDENVYNISNAPVSGISHTDDNSMTIGGNIQHPTVHYRNTSTSGVCDTQYYNMWDAQQTNTTIAAAATVKTVYDPCPPGFCVPTIGLYNYISSQTVPEFSKGYTYSGVFFPASGCRYSDSGDLGDVGSNGYYWSATPRGGTSGRYFYFYSGSWGLNRNSRTYGYPVRAVAE